MPLTYTMSRLYNIKELKQGKLIQLTPSGSDEDDQLERSCGSYGLICRNKSMMDFSEFRREEKFSSFMSENHTEWLRSSGLKKETESDKRPKFKKSVSHEELVMPWMRLSGKPCCPQLNRAPRKIFLTDLSQKKDVISQTNINERKMQYVEKWLNDSQTYNRNKNRKNPQKQSDTDRLRISMNCPSWMKTAGQMRRNRTKCKKEQVKESELTSLIKGDENADDWREDQYLCSCLHNEDNPKPFKLHYTGSALAGDVHEQANATCREQLYHNNSMKPEFMSMKTIDHNGVNLSCIFKEIKQRGSVFVSCCFQYENMQTTNSRKPAGFLTYKRIESK